MIPTAVRHLPGCSLTKGMAKQDPQPGAGVVIYKCRECGAPATSRRDIR